MEDGLEPRQLLTFELKSVLFAPQAADVFSPSTEVQSFVVAFTQDQDPGQLKITLGAESALVSPHLKSGYVVRFSSPVNVYVTAERIAQLPNFKYLFPEITVTPQKFGAPNDPLFPDQWHLRNTGQGGGLAGIDANVINVWDQYTGSGVTVQISDTGLELGHEDLAPNAGAPNLHFDYVDNDSDPSPATGEDHGTAVAGVAVGRGNNAIGISGAAPNAELAGVRIIGPVGDSRLAASAAHQSGIVDVNNNSWGIPNFMFPLGPQEAAAYRNGTLQGRGGLGIIYVFAAGNSRATADNVNYHGQQSSRYTVTVGAIADSGQIAGYSTPGAKILVSAPSNGGASGITTTDRVGDNGYNQQGGGDGDALADTNYTSTFGGTSSAAPLVSGVIALMLDANPNLTWREVQDILVHSSRKVNPNNASWANNGAGLPFSHDYGFGMIDANAAVAMALNYTPMRPEISATLFASNRNIAIPDNSPTPTTQTVAFNGSLKVTHAELTVTVAHARRGDLEFALVSPLGTRSILAETRTTDTGADYSNWTFTSVNYWDELAVGNWSVEVRDQIAETTGTLNDFSLTLYGTDPDIPVPSKPQIVAPIGVTNSVAPQYQWSTSTNAVSYDLEVSRSNGTVILSRIGLVTTSYTQPTQLVQGDYSLRVRAVNSEGEYSAWSDVAQFTIDIPSPIVPAISRPQGDIGDSFPLFEWNSTANAVTYSLWVSSITTGQRVIFRTGHDSTSYTHFDPLPDGSYRAWVRAFNAVGEYSAWSTPVQFTIDVPIPVAPTITAPSAVTTSINPRIVWTAVDGAASYDLWVNNLSTGRSQYIRQTNLARNPTYFDPPVLTQGNYTAWVRAANGNGEYSPWSAAYSFTVDILPPATPRMTGPLGLNGSTTVTTVTPTFTWTAAARASLYDLWVNNMTTGQAQIVRKSDITTTSYTSIVNLTQGEYRAFIRGINSAGEVGEWSSAFIFTIDEPAPSVPTITGPVANPAGSVENANPTFTWTSDVKAPLYELKIDDLTLNTVNVIRVTGINKESYTIPTAKRFAEHTYVAQVRAYNTSGDTSAWSKLYRFRIDVPEPSTPTLLGPGDTSRDTTPEFTWTHASNSVRYEILVRDLIRGENIVLNVTTFGLRPDGTTAYYVLPNAQALRPSTYRFWIRAFNSLGRSSSWSSSKTFVISAKLDPSLLQDGDMFAKADEVMLASAVMPADPQQTDDDASESPNQSFNAQPQAPANGHRDSMTQPSHEARVAVIAADGDDAALIDATMWMLSDPSVGMESRTTVRATTRS